MRKNQSHNNHGGIDIDSALQLDHRCFGVVWKGQATFEDDYSQEELRKEFVGYVKDYTDLEEGEFFVARLGSYLNSN